MKRNITIVIILFAELTTVKAFAQTGYLDLAFGANGITINSIDVRSDYLLSTKVVASGSIYSTGMYSRFHDQAPYRGYFISKHKSNGFLDSSFASGGIFRDTLLGGAFLSDVEVLSNSSIIAGGGSASSPSNPLLIKLNSNGTYDSTFGVNGKTWVNTGRDISINKIKVQQDNKIIASINYYDGVGDYDWGLMRFLPNGFPDSSFGFNGIMIYNHPSTYQLTDAMTIEQDGKIILTGRQYLTFAESVGIVTRIDSTGQVDSAFGNNGTVLISTPISQGYCVLLGVTMQSDGKIIATGYSIEDLGGGFYDNHFLLTRILSSGNLDSTFGNNGLVISDIYSGVEFSNESVVQSDGKIVTIGSASEPFPIVQNYLALVRYLPNGLLDSSFNNDGIVIENISMTEGQAGTSINICPDGGILASGRVWESDTTGFFNIFLAKYHSGLSNEVQELNDRNSLVSIYPNPATEEIHFSSQSPIQSIVVYDCLGRICMSKTDIQCLSPSLNVSALSSEIYFCKIFFPNPDVQPIVKIFSKIF